SQNGMVQRTPAAGISKMGRSTQGVRVMNIKDDDRVSAVALVVESEEGDGAAGAPEDNGQGELPEASSDGAGE
ncbi:MAG TPA: DNA gyrase C-terminal beta-propeller domain-containing protein, partial [Solirubrobacterales bacterium]|nr:DNA gyrase C-terminal beta-propeller domain-containing protein [Solirubrobacterales bacterium]